MKMINQCQGCQAGWPLKANTSLHEVSGGYENELAVCEKRRYMETVRPTEQLDKDKS